MTHPQSEVGAFDCAETQARQILQGVMELAAAYERATNAADRNAAAEAIVKRFGVTLREPGAPITEGIRCAKCRRWCEATAADDSPTDICVDCATAPLPDTEGNPERADCGCGWVTDKRWEFCATHAPPAGQYGQGEGQCSRCGGRYPIVGGRKVRAHMAANGEYHANVAATTPLGERNTEGIPHEANTADVLKSECWRCGKSVGQMVREHPCSGTGGLRDMLLAEPASGRSAEPQPASCDAAQASRCDGAKAEPTPASGAAALGKIGSVETGPAPQPRLLDRVKQWMTNDAVTRIRFAPTVEMMLGWYAAKPCAERAAPLIRTVIIAAEKERVGARPSPLEPDQQVRFALDWLEQALFGSDVDIRLTKVAVENAKRCIRAYLAGAPLEPRTERQATPGNAHTDTRCSTQGCYCDYTPEVRPPTPPTFTTVETCDKCGQVAVDVELPQQRIPEGGV